VLAATRRHLAVPPVAPLTPAGQGAWTPSRYHSGSSTRGKMNVSPGGGEWSWCQLRSPWLGSPEEVCQASPPTPGDLQRWESSVP
jgi:hypothetical protein